MTARPDPPRWSTAGGRGATPRRPTTHPRAGARVALALAVAAGLLHAAASLFWACGGTWLLSTVGAWAVDLVQDEPVRARLLLGAIGVAKAVAALLPLALARGLLPHPRAWRGLCWLGGVLLVGYGGLNVLAGTGALFGVVRPTGGVDHAALIGHVALWDPLFLVWGAALLLWLRGTRPAPS